MPRVLAFTPDASLSKAISAFRSTRNELAVVASPEALNGVGPAVSDFEERERGVQGGDGATCNVRTFLVEVLLVQRERPYCTSLFYSPDVFPIYEFCVFSSDEAK